jgi:hypothetical protein
MKHQPQQETKMVNDDVTVWGMTYFLADEANLGKSIRGLMNSAARRWPGATDVEIEDAIAGAVASLRQDGTARLDRADELERFVRSSSRREWG